MFTRLVTITLLLPLLTKGAMQPASSNCTGNPYALATALTSSTAVGSTQNRSEFLWPTHSTVSTVTLATTTATNNASNLSLTIPAPTLTPSPTNQTHTSLDSNLTSWVSFVGRPTYIPSALTSWVSFVGRPTPLSSALPSSPTPSSASESSPGDLFVCTDTNFTGTCNYIQNVTYQCNNLPVALQHTLTSIRPDKGQLCIFYNDEDCHGDTDSIRWPGSGNMRGRRFDNEVVSWYCSDDNCEGVQAPGGCSKHPDGSPKADPY